MKPKSYNDFNFDFPDYAGLPKIISNRLRPDHVDILQESLYRVYQNTNTKKEFAIAICDLLSLDIVQVK
jgi:hypothetical protein